MKLVYSGRVQRDEIIVVDPGYNTITVDQRNVSERQMKKGNIHRIYFAPGGEGQVREIRIGEEIRMEER